MKRLIELVFLPLGRIVSPKVLLRNSTLGFRLALHQKSSVRNVISILTEH